jgi:hypothetical protein
MSLDTITQRIAKPTMLIEVGWKIFNITPALGGSIFSDGTREIPRDTWIIAEEKPIGGGSISYTSGFHIYPESREAPRWSLRVYYRQVHTIGTRSQKKVVVAREMFLSSRSNEWPPLHSAAAPPRHPNALQDE